MTESITKAVAKREEPTPGALIRANADSFTAVLPTHVKPDTWIRLSTGALKKGKKFRDERGRETPATELEVAALNNPAAFMSSLLDAARLGLEPGTEQYYLTPRKVKNRGLEILGIVGYQGYIELMYRAGAISSVVAEVVYTGDQFDYRPGVDERPTHVIDWDADDRGRLRLVYAYAVMKDGATSKVVVMNRAAITKVKASSQGSDSEYSPWQKHEAAMWLKSAVRQLAKWVPTSAEYIREQLRAQADVASEQNGEVKHLGGGWIEAPGEPIEGELVDDDNQLRDDDPDLAGGVA
jgi:recombination protein RecT